MGEIQEEGKELGTTTMELQYGYRQFPILEAISLVW
jgi:hypothetical protein